MKKLSLVTALVMTLILMLSFSAAAAFTAPDYDPANTTEDIGLMLANNIEFEGVVGIQTTGTFNSAWRTAVLFELDSETGAYKAIETFPAGGTGPDWTIGDNQFIVEANGGNNWPELFAGATGDEWYYNDSNMQGIPYKDCPNFNNDKEQAWGTVLASVQVGDLYHLVGVDPANAIIIANYPVDETYAHITNNADYVTYSYLTPYIEGVTDTTSKTVVPIESQSETSDNGESQSETPDTGDSRIIVLAVLFVVALAGTVVVVKKR